VVTAPMRRRQVAYGMRRGLSQRRACRLFSVARSALSYQSKLAIKDAPALTAMRRLAREYPRFGYRRIAILLRREGFPMSFDRAWRLCRQLSCKCLRSAAADGQRAHGRGPERPSSVIMCGPTISCLIAALTARF